MTELLTMKTGRTRVRYKPSDGVCSVCKKPVCSIVGTGLYFHEEFLKSKGTVRADHQARLRRVRGVQKHVDNPPS